MSKHLSIKVLTSIWNHDEKICRFGGGYPVPNKPIIQPVTHLTYVIPI